MTDIEPTPEQLAEDDRQGPLRWWRRRRWQAAAVSLAVIGAAAGIAIVTSGRGDDLPGTPPRIRYSLYDKKPGDTNFSMGVRLVLEPGRAVQIVEAKALFSANVEYLGAYAVWPKNFVSPGLTEGFPYADQKVRHPLTEPIPAAETAVLDPESQQYLPVVVTLGFRILSGKGGVNGIHLTYKVDGKTKRQYFPLGAIGCVKPLRCEGDNQRTDRAAFRELGLIRGD